LFEIFVVADAMASLATPSLRRTRPCSVTGMALLCDGRGPACGTAYCVSRAGSATEACLRMPRAGFRRRTGSLEINAGQQRRHG
jgi:hypothetical protein